MIALVTGANGHIGSHRIAFITRVTGAHQGPFMTPVGPVAPTGRKVSWRACDVLAFRGNKIARWEAFLDLASLSVQLAGS